MKVKLASLFNMRYKIAKHLERNDIHFTFVNGFRYAKNNFEVFKFLIESYGVICEDSFDDDGISIGEKLIAINEIDLLGKNDYIKFYKEILFNYLIPTIINQEVTNILINIDLSESNETALADIKQMFLADKAFEPLLFYIIRSILNNRPFSVFYYIGNYFNNEKFHNKLMIYLYTEILKQKLHE